MPLAPLLLAASFALADDFPASVSGHAAPQSQTLTPEEYQKGLQTLRKYLQSRGEKQEDIDQFIGDLEQAAPPPRDVLADFLKYEQAWARKTRDGKNDNVTPKQLEHEKQRYAEMKSDFFATARSQSPAFFSAFEGAVKDVRAKHHAAPGTSVSGQTFGDNIDDSYTQVDAGDEALANGDAATAAQDAQQAISENSANPDAFALQAGAALAQGDPAAAAQAAQTALSLDPTNPAAQAISSLAGGMAAPTANTLGDAGAMSGSLQNQSAPPPSDASVAGATGLTGLSPGLAPVPAPYANLAVPPPTPGTPAPPPPSATPLLASSLASQLGEQAARTMNTDPAAGMRGIAQAISLDPSNADLWRLQAAALQRAGDYHDALAAANRAEFLAPKDARTHYARAEALAFNKEKTEMVDELRQAAAIDPSYQPVVNSALQQPNDADLTLLFPDAREPLSAPAQHRRLHHKLWRRFWMTMGAIGGLLVLIGLIYGFLADREERRARPKLESMPEPWRPY